VVLELELDLSGGAAGLAPIAKLCTKPPAHPCTRESDDGRHSNSFRLANAPIRSLNSHTPTLNPLAHSPCFSGGCCAPVAVAVPSHCVLLSTRVLQGCGSTSHSPCVTACQPCTT
jgi:hypothetical protein